MSKVYQRSVFENTYEPMERELYRSLHSQEKKTTGNSSSLFLFIFDCFCCCYTKSKGLKGFCSLTPEMFVRGADMSIQQTWKSYSFTANNDKTLSFVVDPDNTRESVFPF